MARKFLFIYLFLFFFQSTTCTSPSIRSKLLLHNPRDYRTDCRRTWTHLSAPERARENPWCPIRARGQQPTGEHRGYPKNGFRTALAVSRWLRCVWCVLCSSISSGWCVLRCLSYSSTSLVTIHYRLIRSPSSWYSYSIFFFFFLSTLPKTVFHKPQKSSHCTL